MIIPELRHLGLTDTEARMYLALLESGTMSVALLSKRIGVPSDDTYDILGALREKGVVEADLEGTVKYFRAVSPEKLLSGFYQKGKLFEHTEGNQVRQAQPGQLYEGVEGIRHFLKDMLEEGETIVILSQIEDLREYMGENFFDEWNKERINQKVPLRILSLSSEFKAPLAECRNLEKARFRLPADFVICGNYLGIIERRAANGEYAILLYGKDMAVSFRSLFEAAWEGIIS